VLQTVCGRVFSVNVAVDSTIEEGRKVHVNRRVEIYGDASFKGLDCMLIQHDRVVAYAPRQWRPQELNMR